MLSVQSPPSHAWAYKQNRVCWREHVVCFFPVSCVCVFSGDPVKGKTALLYRRVRGPRQSSPSRPSFFPPLYVLPPLSLQPCAQTDTHKMFQEGRMSCMVPTCIHSLWHELPMQHCTRQTWFKHGPNTADTFCTTSRLIAPHTFFHFIHTTCAIMQRDTCFLLFDKHNKLSSVY